MAKQRILTIFGTRPEAVKMAPVVRELANTPDVESLVCVTAQHREMLDQVLDLFEIHPDVDLDLMRPDQSLSELTAAVFTKLDPYLRQVKPDWILLQGDTTTVMAASLTAFYHQVRVGHVEAGLRTHDKLHPFPEEINRRVAGVVADLHFAPTDWARDNLLREGVDEKRVIVTGNTVIDALQTIAARPSPESAQLILNRLGIKDGDSAFQTGHATRLVLITAHRRENFGEPIESICQAIRRLSQAYGDSVQFLYPVHLNPNIQGPVHRNLGDVANVTLTDPIDYLTLVHLMKRASLVLTDSGGIQEEAPSFGVPVLVLREVTERPEGIHAGTVRLVGTDTHRIVSETCRLLDDPDAYAQMAQSVNPYGDGHAAGRIVQAIVDYEG